MELNRLRQVRHLLPGTARIIEVHSLVTHSKCDLETPTALVSSYRWHKGSTPSRGASGSQAVSPVTSAGLSALRSSTGLIDADNNRLKHVDISARRPIAETHVLSTKRHSMPRSANHLEGLRRAIPVLLAHGSCHSVGVIGECACDGSSAISCRAEEACDRSHTYVYVFSLWRSARSPSWNSILTASLFRGLRRLSCPQDSFYSRQRANVRVLSGGPCAAPVVLWLADNAHRHPRQRSDLAVDGTWERHEWKRTGALSVQMPQATSRHRSPSRQRRCTFVPMWFPAYA